MLWFTLALVIALIVGIFAGIVEKDSAEAAFAFFGTGLLATIIAFLLNFMIWAASASDTPDHVRNIYALDEMDGETYVSFSKDGDSTASYYMHVDQDGHYYNKMADHDADYVQVVEDNSEKPRVEEWSCASNNGNFWTVFHDSYVCQYVLFVPEGSVKGN